MNKHKAGEVVCAAADFLQRFVNCRDMTKKQIEDARECVNDLWQLSVDLDEGFDDEQD